MGYEITIGEAIDILSLKNNKAIIICVEYDKIKDEFDEFCVVSLGSLLSDVLQRYPNEKRHTILLDVMDKILLGGKEDNLLVKDIDILFNPEYKIDVLKYFANIARVKRIAVIWDGIIENGYLQYSERGYLDYRKYLIKNYDVICIN